VEMEKSNATLLCEGTWVKCNLCGCSTLELQEKATIAFAIGRESFSCPECGGLNEMGNSDYEELPEEEFVFKREPVQTKLTGKDPREIKWYK